MTEERNPHYEPIPLPDDRVEDRCPYCGGGCPTEPDDSPNLCDGFAGDIDGLCESDPDASAD
jgi:hypothetical protein